MGSRHTSAKRRKYRNDLPPDGVLEPKVRQLPMFSFWGLSSVVTVSPNSHTAHCHVGPLCPLGLFQGVSFRSGVALADMIYFCSKDYTSPRLVDNDDDDNNKK